MANKTEQRYWDSSACLAYLAEEKSRVDDCQLVLDAAANGDVELIISALTISEVLMLRGEAALPKKQSEIIRRFFRREYFVVVDVDRHIAEYSQELVWDLKVKPKDAIHIATALDMCVPVFDTFDDKLLKLSGKVGGTPTLTICKPGDGMQPYLPLGHDP